jgi:hypothetical protein
MTSYKNIPHFDDCDSEDILVWRELLLSYLDTHHPETAQLLLTDVFDELGQIGRDGEVDEGVDDNEADDAEAVVAAVIGQDDEADIHDRIAKGFFVLFLGPTQRRQLLHLNGSMGGSSRPIRAMARRTRPSVAGAVRVVQGSRNSCGYVQSFDGLCLQLIRVGMAQAPRAAI